MRHRSVKGSSVFPFRAMVNFFIQDLDDASPAFNEPITAAKIADARWLLDACEELRLGWLPHLPSRPTEVPVGKVRHAPVPTRPVDWTQPDLHEAARSLPQTDRAFKSLVDSVWDLIENVSIEYNAPVLSDETIAEVPRLLDAIAELREEWSPWLQSGTLP